MNVLDFLIPDNIQDTPRLFTGIAEWVAVFGTIFVYKRKQKGLILALICVQFLVLQTGFQLLAGTAPISLWIPDMIIAVLLMFFFLKLILDVPLGDLGFLCIQSFLLAEFAASLYRQLYVWFAGAFMRSVAASVLMMLFVYTAVFLGFLNIDRKNASQNENLNISSRDFLSALATGVGAFSLSNLSFIWSDTPFSADSNGLLYVRTLVDFGGLLMLMTQKFRINETAIARENAAINQLFRRQYEQYKLSIDNSELLRMEIHDLKHYLIALKNEDDPERRKEYLDTIEQEIAVQEVFQNTGNKVLDVILTNKSLACKKSGITLNPMIDGNLVQFMHVRDICALFGNLLDNAIEAVQQVSIPEKKIITLSVKKKNNFIIIECENACERDLGLSGRSFLPKTTKGDKTVHGYGLKSMLRIAEKYGGSMTMSQGSDERVTTKVLLQNQESLSS